MLVAKIQKPNTPWTDEANITIPFNRISKVEALKERKAGELYKAATKITESLQALLKSVNTANEEVSKALADEIAKGGKTQKETKGNFTWFNFDRSIKIEVNVNETIRFDEALIAAARELFDKFITDNVQGTDDIVRQLINTAFANTKGGLDAKKVMSLLKFRTKIKAANFQKALDYIEQSISRPSSKRYFRIWAKDENGAYQNIELNFSSI